MYKYHVLLLYLDDRQYNLDDFQFILKTNNYYEYIKKLKYFHRKPFLISCSSVIYYTLESPISYNKNKLLIDKLFLANFKKSWNLAGTTEGFKVGKFTVYSLNYESSYPSYAITVILKYEQYLDAIHNLFGSASDDIYPHRKLSEFISFHEIAQYTLLEEKEQINV